MKKLIESFFYLTLLFQFSALFATEVKVTINPKVIHFGDSASLFISSDTKLTHEIDFSPLTTDFDIVSQSQNFSTKIINGQFSQTHDWHLNLLPKRTGTLIIPSLTINGVATSPESLDVLKPAANDAQDSLLFIETSIDPVDQVFEQQQLTYTIRLFFATQLVQANLSEIKSNDSNMLVEKLGQDRQYEQIRNGKKFNVFERQYAVFPQMAGDLVFSPLVFDGKIVTGRASFFEVETQHKRLESDSHHVKVQSIPPPFNRKNWLIAQDVTIRQDWSKDLSQLSIDEPVTRTIVIEADGCPGSQIPRLSVEAPEAFKQYFDKAETNHQSSENGLKGSLTLKVAMIPTQSGDFVLPSLSIPWWNATTGKIETASIPATTLSIPEAPISMASEVNSPTSYPVESTPLISVAPLNQDLFSPLHWREVVSLSLNVLLLCTTIYLYRKYRRDRLCETTTLRKIKSQLRQACKKNQAKEAERYFLEWFKYYHPTLKSHHLLTAKEHLPHEFDSLLRELSKHLYSQDTEYCSWEGAPLWKAISRYKVKHDDTKHKKKGDPLSPLYPIESVWN